MSVFASARLRTVAIILLVVLCVYGGIALMPAPENHKGDNPFMRDGELPMIVAHRGGADEFPGNTLEAFYHAYSIDESVMLETDVNITKDGVLILLHNELLDATTNVTGLASDWNYTDLISQRVNFGYDNPTEDTVLAGEREYFCVDGVRRLPTDVDYPEGVTARDDEIFLATTLEELLVAFPDNLISIEIKQNGELGLAALEEAVRLLDKYDAFGRSVLTSFHPGVCREIKRMQRRGELPEDFRTTPGLIGAAKYYILANLGLDALFTDGVSTLALPCEEYGFRFDTERLVRVAHEHNLSVMYWTVDDEDEMRYLIELGVDGIMTDNPTLLKKVLDEYRNDNNN